MKCFEYLAGIEQLATQYDGFLLDQFGVLHNGERAFEGAIEALDIIREAGRKVIILSNSGKRSIPNIDRLERLGIERYMFDDLLSSGETAWLGLQNRSDLTFAGLGKSCLYISRGGDKSAIDGLPLELTEDADEATFIFLAGLDADTTYRQRVEEWIEQGLERGLPMLCTNPDKISLEGDRHVPGPGALAENYAERGGDVRYVGKPWPAIYRAAIYRLNLRVDQIVAVGDSLSHDIKGAEAFGIDGALITNGVHKSALEGSNGPALSVRQLAEQAMVTPRWILSDFAPAGKDGMRHAC